ncbi:MAG: FAD-dependent oxidoreductase [Firmicutes bacterium]|nr:FAD-dependent oxidoreductase [Bacillota bacterium]
MQRFVITAQDEALAVVEGIYRDLERRVAASPPDVCPVTMASVFLQLCHAQTCGKCVPCRVGLAQLELLIAKVLDGEADSKTIERIENTAKAIVASADCAIGVEAASMVLRGVKAFRDDYDSHAQGRGCVMKERKPIPCVSRCPASVDIPGYIALVRAERYADAVRLIRKDNPFPTACSYICEHPCEKRCRRHMLDDAINIRALKRFACDNAGEVPAAPKAPSTGKKVAVVGGGPSGLTAAYYLSLMGHQVVVFEQRKKLGGMMRYGIPSYRFPRHLLDAEIAHILSTGIEARTEQTMGKDFTLEQLEKEYDSVYLAIGAQSSKKLGIKGETARGVLSAVEMLQGIGDGEMPDFTGKHVVVVGGGNVAMDITRSAKRLGAEKVTCVYRRRQSDMTALPEEIEGSIAEGCEMLCLHAPVKIETDKEDNVKALWVKRQMVGPVDRSGRPSPVDTEAKQFRIPADYVITAIGQDVQKELLAEPGVPVVNGPTVSGGDCVSGPATVILAIAAGKKAALAIDQRLGFHHEIKVDVEIPPAYHEDRIPCGRGNMTEREAGSRARDFDGIENGLVYEEAMQEAGRCLRCDHYGFGALRGGRDA